MFLYLGPMATSINSISTYPDATAFWTQPSRNTAIGMLNDKSIGEGATYHPHKVKIAILASEIDLGPATEHAS
jgi:hypothetical protein